MVKELRSENEKSNIDTPPFLIIDLFPRSGAGFVEMKEDARRGETFHREQLESQTSLTRVVEQLKIKKERIDDARLDWSEEIKMLDYSRTCSVAYRNMHIELTQKGLNDEQIMSFYLSCLSVNTEFYQKGEGVGKKNGDIKRQSVGESRYPEFLNIIRQKIGVKKPPEWFHSRDSSTWVSFVFEHASFMYYLNPDLIAKYNAGGIPKREFIDILHITEIGAYPDWLSDYEGRVVPLDVVENELARDTAEKDVLVKQMGEAKTRIITLSDICAKKIIKSDIWLVQRLNSLFPQIDTLPRLIAYLYATQGLTTLVCHPVSSTYKELCKAKESGVNTPERMRANSIYKYLIEDNRLVSSEILSVWIEKLLFSKKIIGNSDRVLSQSVKSATNLLLEDMQLSNETTQKDLLAVKGQDKSIYNALQHHIRPLLSRLNSNEIVFLQEYISDSTCRMYSDFIKILGDFTSLSLNRDEGNSELKNIAKFAGSWLLRDWEMLFKSMLQDPEKKQELEEIEVDDPDSWKEDIKEYQKLADEVEGNNLNGWKIYYSEKYTLDIENCVVIAGETLQEREESLTDFIMDNQIPYSIPMGSIVRALNQIPLLPVKDEWVMMKESFDGVSFRKTKRAGMRIFWVRDLDARNIFFFLHKKNDYRYARSGSDFHFA